MKTYEIKSYKCIANHDGLTNVIETIFWGVTEPIDIDGTTYDITATHITKLPQVNPTNFIEVDSLTKEQVVGWIETYSDVEELLERAVAIKRIQLNPPHIDILPNFE